MRSKTISVIGAGFAGLAAASVLGAEGYNVNVYEKNDQCGGRARMFQEKGFTFDMGPSWYWMPDVFESFYARFEKSASDFYELKKLSPSYRVFFGKDDAMDIPDSMEVLYELFESVETGSALHLRRFLKEAEEKYRIAIHKRLVYFPSLSWQEYRSLLWKKETWKLQLVTSFHSHVRAFFRNPRLLALMEFPVLFLGAMPQNTPALYSLMNYAGLSLGTWYPMGGMYKTVDAMLKIATGNGVKIYTGQEVQHIKCRDRKLFAISVNGEEILSDAVVAAADYNHVEQNMLPQEYRMYDPHYWNTRVMSPSSLIFFLGVNGKVKNLLHHNLFFDADFSKHAHEIYADPAWPSSPLFYVCCPSKTDASVAPEGKENLFILIPIASGLKDGEDMREKYFSLVMERLENITGNSFSDKIEVKKSYCLNDFSSDYHAFKGNAYGLANTFLQSAFLRPRMQSRKVNNLFYAGQLTVPGPGIPPAIISGQIAAQQVIKYVY